MDEITLQIKLIEDTIKEIREIIEQTNYSKIS